MTLSDELKAALAATSSFASGQQALEVSHAPLHLRCELTALDSLACAFTLLAVKSTAMAPLSTERLKALSEGLAARLNYLLEPISPIEVDAHGCVVQLRSNPPLKDEDRTSYYELLAERDGTLSLRRYMRSSGQPRTAITAEVTREVLLRLTRDFAAALS